jgi:hypothetical protein
MSRAAPVPAPARELRIELVPPILYADANQEQGFTMNCRPSGLPPGAFGITRRGEPSRDVQCMASRVSFNSVRLRRAESVDGTLTVSPHAIREGDEAGAELVEFLSTKVPVMMHDALAWVRITSIDTATGARVWQRTLPYLLDSRRFPPGRLSSKWGHATDSAADARVSLADIAREEFHFAGNEQEVALRTDDGSLRVHLTIETVTNKATGEPISFHLNRVHALRKIAVIADAAMLP